LIKDYYLASIFLQQSRLAKVSYSVDKVRIELAPQKIAQKARFEIKMDFPFRQAFQQ
jgi:hypothetical protein